MVLSKVPSKIKCKYQELVLVLRVKWANKSIYLSIYHLPIDRSINLCESFGSKAIRYYINLLCYHFTNYHTVFVFQINRVNKIIHPSIQFRKANFCSHFYNRHFLQKKTSPPPLKNQNWLIDNYKKKYISSECKIPFQIGKFW